VAGLINKIKQSAAGISWPNFKSVCGDTVMVFLTASILSTLIALWSYGVEEIVNWVTSLF
jgi:preprotein translocase SecE subunit